LLVVMLLCGIPALGQNSPPAESHSTASETPPLLRTDKVLPPLCGVYLADIATHTVSTASQSYKRLVYVSGAITSAAKSADIALTLRRDLLKDRDLTHLLASVSEDETEAVDSLHCSADIIGRYVPIDDDDNLMRQSFIMSFNQSAEALEALRESELERLSRDDATMKPSASLAYATVIADSYKEQRDASSTLLQATTLALYPAIDVSDKSAASTPNMLLNCKEALDISRRSKPVATMMTESPYKQAAKLIYDFLQDHRCRTMDSRPAPAGPDSSSTPIQALGQRR
jgi:hypothetical protein